MIRSLFMPGEATVLDRNGLKKHGLWFLAVVGCAVWIGQNLPALSFHVAHVQPNLGLDYAMGVLWWSILALGILVFAGESRNMLLVGWAGRFFVTLIGMLFYEQNYGLDSYWYFEIMVRGEYSEYPGLDLKRDLFITFERFYDVSDAPSGATRSTENMIRTIMWIGAVTGPSYHAMKVVYAFIGFLGVWWFYRAIVAALGRPYPNAFYLLAFFPSITHWSSIFGKDPLQFLSLGLYAYGAVTWVVTSRATALIFIVAGLAGTYLIRPWICIIAATALFLATLVGRSSGWQKVSLVLLFGLSVFAWSGEVENIRMLLRLSPQQLEDISSNPLAMLEVIGDRAEGVAADTQKSGGSGVQIDTTKGFSTTNLGEGIFAGLFRPLPFDVRNLFTALAAVENTVVFVWTLVALIRLRVAYLRDPLVLLAALFCLGWATLYGFIVMANFGTGVRYKLQMWPFFLMLLLVLTHREGRSLLESRLPLHKRLPQ